MHASPENRHVCEAEPSDIPRSGAGTLPEREVPFEFSGKGGEYFRIWIVNIVLTILTLGIYSAWAKVRNKQYFYGSTTLDGASFSYIADPVKILLGRLVAAALLGLYVFAESLSVVAGLVMLLVLLVATPWIVCQSLRFNARYSRYRNVSFDFVGRPWDAAKAFVFWPIAGAFTFGLLMPLTVQRQQRFMVSRHRFGESEFDFHAGVGGYYKIFLGAAGALFLLVGGAVFLFAVLANLFGVLGSMIGGLLIGLIYMAILPGVTAALANRRYNHTTLEGHRFNADWRILSYAGIVVSNTLLTLLTLGLYYPWGKVRVARYKAQHTRVYARGDLDQFVEGQRDKAGPVAEGVSDLFDFDIGL